MARHLTHFLPSKTSIKHLVKNGWCSLQWMYLVFPGQTLTRPISEMTLMKVMRDSALPFTVLGFRSAFRDWEPRTGYPGEVAKAALAHTNSNKVEAAYRRTDFL